MILGSAGGPDVGRDGMSPASGFTWAYGYSAEQSQNTVTTYFPSKQLLPFDFAGRYWRNPRTRRSCDEAVRLFIAGTTSPT